MRRRTFQTVLDNNGYTGLTANSLYSAQMPRCQGCLPIHSSPDISVAVPSFLIKRNIEGLFPEQRQGCMEACPDVNWEFPYDQASQALG